MRRLAVFALLPATLAGCIAASTGGGSASTPPATGSATIDTARLFSMVRALADDSMRGRRVGTPDGARARRYVLAQMRGIGVSSIVPGDTQSFTFTPARGAAAGEPVRGVNVMGVVRGTDMAGKFIVVSAHYDHVGVGRPVNGDSIYNGADDNASGTATLLEVGRWFAAHPPHASILLVAFDGEESGLQGAKAFVASPPVPLFSLLIDANMDMVSHNDRGELYVTGTYQFPALKPYVQRVAARAPLKLLLGHDTPQDTGENNWVNSSDQGPFNAAHIPFLYFGVEDHPDYHQPSDEWRTVTPVLFRHAAETVLDMVRELDANAAALAAMRR